MLVEYAQAEALTGDEVRQAAIWGLGKDGLRAYARLLPFLGVPAQEELTAVCAFGPDAGAALADQLVAVLADQATPERKRVSASVCLGQDHTGRVRS